MTHKIQYLKVKFCLGSISVLVGLAGATIALFRWIESTGLQYFFGDLSRYILGFGGFAAMILGALLANDAWVLRDVLMGRYEVPLNYAHAPVRLAVVPKPAEGTRILFEGNATPVLERSGNTRMVCDRCGELLADGISRGLIRNAVIRCPACGAYCEPLQPTERFNW